MTHQLRLYFPFPSFEANKIKFVEQDKERAVREFKNKRLRSTGAEKDLEYIIKTK